MRTQQNVHRIIQWVFGNSYKRATRRRLRIYNIQYIYVWHSHEPTAAALPSLFVWRVSAPPLSLCHLAPIVHFNSNRSDNSIQLAHLKSLVRSHKPEPIRYQMAHTRKSYRQLEQHGICPKTKMICAFWWCGWTKLVSYTTQHTQPQWAHTIHHKYATSHMRVFARMNKRAQGHRSTYLSIHTQPTILCVCCSKQERNIRNEMEENGIIYVIFWLYCIGVVFKFLILGRSVYTVYWSWYVLSCRHKPHIRYTLYIHIWIHTRSHRIPSDRFRVSCVVHRRRRGWHAFQYPVLVHRRVICFSAAFSMNERNFFCSAQAHTHTHTHRCVLCICTTYLVRLCISECSDILQAWVSECISKKKWRVLCILHSEAFLRVIQSSPQYGVWVTTKRAADSPRFD